MAIRHILEMQQFSQGDLLSVFGRAYAMEQMIADGLSGDLGHMIMATLFYEPSTRTRLSFEAAMHRMGGKVISTENAKEFSSAAKGETLEDTIRTVGSYADVIVLRHFEAGAAKRAAAVSSVPIINAGDGVGQHPTQALLDAFTILKRLGQLENLTVTMVGDLANGRTVRSLAYLLSKFKNNRFIFVAPSAVAMQKDIISHMDRHGVAHEEIIDIQEAAKKSDVMYVTRIQKERFGGNPELLDSILDCFIMDDITANLMPEKSIIMHPLPRVNELLPEVDSNPRAAYFDQVQNGLYIRMALLDMLLHK